MPELAPNGDDYGASFLTNSSGSLAMFAAIRRASNPRSWDKAPDATDSIYLTRREVRVIVEPNYCLAELVGT